MRAEGADVSGARLEHVLLKDSRLEGVNLDGASLAGCVFADCRMAGAWLTGLRARDWKLERCDLTRASVVGTPLRDQDLSEGSIEGLVLSESAAELRGAVVSPLQAVELARLLGVRVR